MPRWKQKNEICVNYNYLVFSSLTIMLNIFIDFQPDYLGRPTTGTTGNGYTRGWGRVENLTYWYGLGRVTIS